jgi:hypothetical protein
MITTQLTPIITGCTTMVVLKKIDDEYQLTTQLVLGIYNIMTAN